MTRILGQTIHEPWTRPFEMRAWRERAGLSASQIMKGLELSYRQLLHCTQGNYLPACVAKRLVLIWNTHGLKLGAPTRSRGRAWRLPASYADAEHHPVVEVTLPVAQVSPSGAARQPNGAIIYYPKAVAPESVPWEMYVSTMRVLLEHTATLLQEKIAIDTENARLQRLNNFLQNDADAKEPLRVLAHIRPLKRPEDATLNGMSLLATVTKDEVSGLDLVINDLNSRFPKSAGLRS